MPVKLDSDARPEERMPLTRERVLHAAIALADARGIEALTMRRLGQELGVEAMSLYNHVANKHDILNGILELVMAEIELPASDAPWKTAIRGTAISAHDVLLRHQWACTLMMSPTRTSPSRLRWMDAVLRCMREGGFSAQLTCHAYHVLASHIEGSTMWVGNLPALGEDLKTLAADFLRDFSAADYPYMAEHIQQHLKPANPNNKRTFEFGLDLILDGLERMQAA